MKCVNCGSAKMELIIGKTVTMYHYENKNGNNIFNENVIENGDMPLNTEKRFCLECGCVSEFVTKESLKDFMGIKEYIKE